MRLSPADEALIADMKQRQFHIKKRQRATDAILYQERRFRAMLLLVVGVVVASVAAGIFWAALRTVPHRSGWWLPLLVFVVLGAILGVQLGQSLLRTRWGRRLLAQHERRLRQRYSGDLHAGRRWLQFYFRGEDIAPYVPQILYFVEEERRLDSVQAALALAKANQRHDTLFAQRALEAFNDVAGQATVVVVSSSDHAGFPSSRIMRFVTSDRPGVWYVTSAPEGLKVEQFDGGRIALVTTPTGTGATISSNRVRIRRAQLPFPDVADLYRTQVPGYVDGMTEDEQRREVVFEVTLQSAKVDTWFDHEVVEFRR
jgi:hypothetical protein